MNLSLQKPLQNTFAKLLLVQAHFFLILNKIFAMAIYEFNGFKPVIKEQIKTSNYHCLECGVDMGNYPGQLCRKWYCDEKDYFV